MLKGINKQVLEIHDTGTEYFEKALLFVRPEYASLSEERLREKFVRAFSGATVPGNRSSRRSRTAVAVVCMLLSAFFGAFVTLLIK